MRPARAAALLALAAALGMARRPPERKTMDDIAKTGLTTSEWSGGQCAATEPGVRVVTTPEAWAKLWKDDIGADAPAADFSKVAAVAVFVGVKPTGGWGVEFLPPETRGADAVVPYRVRGPAAGGFVIQAFTQPYAVRLYRRPPGKLTAEERR